MIKSDERTRQSHGKGRRRGRGKARRRGRGKAWRRVRDGPVRTESYRRPRTRFVLVPQSALFTCDGQANILLLLFRLAAGAE